MSVINPIHIESFPISISIFQIIPISILLRYNKKDCYFHTKVIIIPISISILSFILVKLDISNNNTKMSETQVFLMSREVNEP